MLEKIKGKIHYQVHYNLKESKLWKKIKIQQLLLQKTKRKKICGERKREREISFLLILQLINKMTDEKENWQQRKSVGIFKIKNVAEKVFKDRKRKKEIIGFSWGTLVPYLEFERRMKTNTSLTISCADDWKFNSGGR